MPNRPPIFQCNTTRPARVQKKTAERGYGGTWRTMRAAFLAAHPLCAECQRQGRLTPATQVDHIIPHNGVNDPNYWAEPNLQSLCAACHGAKSAGERGRQ